MSKTESILVRPDGKNELGLEKDRINRAVTVVCQLEILKEDLDKTSDQDQEFVEAKRHIESSLAHLNQNTQLLDPTWKGWRVKNFAVNNSAP
jgi:hypothetical protein